MNQSEISCRPIEVKDAALLAALLRDENENSGWSRKLFKDTLALPHHIGIIAYFSNQHDNSIGFISGGAMIDQAEIYLIQVCAEHRRKGIGKTLLHQWLFCLNKNINSVFLEVAAGNIAARQFYQHAGFYQVGRRKNYYPANSNGKPSEDALVLKREMTS